MPDELGGCEKAAVLLVLLGPEVSSTVLHSMPENQIMAVTTAMSKLGDISPQVREQVLSEFTASVDQAGESVNMGADYMETLLMNALGEERASWITTVRSVGYRFG